MERNPHMLQMRNLPKFAAASAGVVALTFGASAAVGAQDQDVADLPDAPVVQDGDSIEETDRAAARQERREARQERRQERRTAVAEILGVSVEELREARSEGLTISDIADDESIDALVEYFVDQATERIETAVETGRITSDEATERLDGLSERITERLENPEDFQRRGGRRG